MSIGEESKTHEQQQFSVDDANKLMCRGVTLFLLNASCDDLKEFLSGRTLTILKPFIDEAVASVVTELEAVANQDGLASMLSHWRESKNVPAIMKSVVPDLMIGAYPYDMPGCLAFYLEQRYVQEERLPEIVW